MLSGERRKNIDKERKEERGYRKGERKEGGRK